LDHRHGLDREHLMFLAVVCSFVACVFLGFACTGLALGGVRQIQRFSWTTNPSFR
jgi:hypothetical protein